jgi:hypothetical protein
MQGEESGALIFPAQTGGKKVHLTIPAVLASVDVPDQNVVVDIGDDPQPDSIIPLDIDIQVLGATVHFSQATFVGDGLNSLRLTLNADEPIQTVDGITPASLEIGKPDRVDDLYGNGMLGGSKDIFIELIRPSGKISGTITIPILRATVIVEGPFEFDFNLTDTSTISPTPAEANPNIFSPLPTPTSLPLTDYSYQGGKLNPGDLLFTAFSGNNSELYAFTPDLDSQPRLLATLPGAVTKVYMQPDYQGIDYLAGAPKFRDGFSYINNIRLYTVRFSEPQPRLLLSFPPNPPNTVGTIIEGDWSFDGQYAIFRLAGNTEPGSAGWRYVWLDLSCRQSGNCAPQQIPLQPSLDLYRGHFAPHDYRFLFTGSDTSGTGKTDMFLLNFDPAQPDLQPVNLMAHLSVGDGITSAAWTAEEKIFSLCHYAQNPEDNAFCIMDPQTGVMTSGELMSSNLDGYRLFGGFWLSPKQNQIAAKIFPENGTHESIPELRLLDFNGHLGDLLVSSQTIGTVTFSPDGAYIAFIFNEEQQLGVSNIGTKSAISVYENSLPQTILWTDWVR